jgi:beta-glucanase (GH16 family)
MVMYETASRSSIPSRSENARVEHGKLVIEARKDNWEGHAITSASLTTEGKAAWKYGRFEMRAKVPAGRGTAPAFWTLGTNVRSEGWPRSGEIDIMEYVGFDPDRIHGYVHTEAYNHRKRNHKGTSILVDKPYADFHTYAVEWTPERLDFYFDGQKYYTYSKKPTMLRFGLLIGSTTLL